MEMVGRGHGRARVSGGQLGALCAALDIGRSRRDTPLAGRVGQVPRAGWETWQLAHAEWQVLGGHTTCSAGLGSRCAW